MTHKFSSDKIYTSLGAALDDTVIITDSEGKILAIESRKDHDPSSVDYRPGFLCAGFVNAHCHLELSHMKGKVDTGTGLLPFINNVVSFRDTNAGEIDDAIKAADEEMYRNGIVAVGDISNKTDSVSVKEGSKLDYYTFVEMFDFLQSKKTNETISQYQEVYANQSDNRFNNKSYVPHAPYSVSPGLFAFINENNHAGQTISIHNQETPHEDELFRYGTGGFRSFYEGFGFDLDFFKPIGNTSIHYAIKHLKPIFNTIFVHNMLTSVEDIKAAQSWNENIFWASCPNANLYIENSLPDYKNFLETGAKVALGTDSLTSNWQLSIWEELKTIRRYASYVPFETLITWATLHGAQALGYDGRLGSIEVGKQPGIIHVDYIDIEKAEIQRLI